MNPTLLLFEMKFNELIQYYIYYKITLMDESEFPFAITIVYFFSRAEP